MTVHRFRCGSPFDDTGHRKPKSLGHPPLLFFVDPNSFSVENLGWKEKLSEP